MGGLVPDGPVVKRHVETFFRHKVLLSAPLILAAFVSVWYVAAQPKKYQSYTTAWFDTAVPAASTVDTGTGFNATPAGLGQSILQELAGTRDFLVKVGHDGPLAAYLAAHPTTKHGPSALLSKLTSLVKSPGGTAAVDDRIVSTLGGAISSQVVGPQILRVTLRGPDPTVTAGTLRVLMNDFQAELTNDRQARDQASVQYYQVRLDAAAKTLADAKAAQVAYEEAHPGVLNNPAADPQFSQLLSSVSNAQTQYAGLQTSFNDASLALTTVGGGTTYHVIDQPNGASVVSHRKKAIFAGVAGIFVGLAISILALTALTATDTAARNREDLEDTENVEVVATIQEMPRRRVSGRTRSS